MHEQFFIEESQQYKRIEFGNKPVNPFIALQGPKKQKKENKISTEDKAEANNV